MKDRVQLDIGTRKPLQNWADINWRLTKKRVRNLRQRIYRATKNQQWNRVRSLMKLMIRSFSNLLLSVRRITQEDPGEKYGGHRCSDCTHSRSGRKLRTDRLLKNCVSNPGFQLYFEYSCLLTNGIRP